MVERDDDLRIGGVLDRRRAEALALEIRALARRFGLDVSDLRVVPDTGQDEASDPPAAESSA